MGRSLLRAYSQVFQKGWIYPGLVRNLEKVIRKIPLQGRAETSVINLMRSKFQKKISVRHLPITVQGMFEKSIFLLKGVTLRLYSNLGLAVGLLLETFSN